MKEGLKILLNFLSSPVFNFILLIAILCFKRDLIVSLLMLAPYTILMYLLDSKVNPKPPSG